MSGQMDKDALNGDMVLIGISAPGLKDVQAPRRSIPAVPGVELARSDAGATSGPNVRLTRPDYAPPLRAGLHA